MESDGPGMGAIASPAWFDASLHWIALASEAAGVLAIVIGGVAATLVFLGRLVRRRDLSEDYHRFRTRLARSILLGLEFLVAADIIGTVAVEPTIENLWVLGLIVLIRTFLSFSLEIEIEGRLPWRKADKDEGAKGRS